MKMFFFNIISIRQWYKIQCMMGRPWQVMVLDNAQLVDWYYSISRECVIFSICRSSLNRSVDEHLTSTASKALQTPQNFLNWISTARGGERKGQIIISREAIKVALFCHVMGGKRCLFICRPQIHFGPLKGVQTGSFEKQALFCEEDSLISWLVLTICGVSLCCNNVFKI